MMVLAMLFQKTYALEQTYHKERSLDVPYREQAIIIGKEGFYPNRITVFKGEKVHFFVTSVGVDSACFNIPDKNVFSSPLFFLSMLQLASYSAPRWLQIFSFV